MCSFPSAQLDTKSASTFNETVCVFFFWMCVCVSTAGDQQRRAEWVMRGGGGDPGCWGPVWQGDWQTGARAVYTLRDPPFRDPGLCYQRTGLQVSMRSFIASLLHYYYNTKVFIIHLGLIVFSLFPFLGQSSFQEGQPLCMQKMPPGSTRPYSPWESLSLGFVMGCRCVCTCMHKQSDYVMAGFCSDWVDHSSFTRLLFKETFVIHALSLSSYTLLSLNSRLLLSSPGPAGALSPPSRPLWH